MSKTAMAMSSTLTSRNSRDAVQPEYSEQEEIRRMMAAEEASLQGGFFERILKFYERWVRRALEHPAMARRHFALILIGVSYVCYNAPGQ